MPESTTPVTPAPTTIGQTVDADLALVKARLAVLEADAKTDWSDVTAWVKANWPHFVTWGMGVAGAIKLGVLKFL